MRLRRVEIQGFKTFAEKTVLEFVSPSSTLANGGITAIVGPNGSGKSNIADAIRWVMGEQGLKLLRSKKSEDVIFSGTDKRTRAGFAEVTMTLVNDDGTSEVDLSEIVVTRRLYRDGQSEYEVNKQSARLADVVLLLAQCGIGQRTYSVIGQGMVDAVLASSPAERKEFFDEAAGLRVFQLKRASAINKLDATRDNLTHADVRLHEIEPRLHSLERQVKRLKEREGIEKDLRDIERLYFGSVWRELTEKLDGATRAHHRAAEKFSAQNIEAETFERELSDMERATPASRDAREIRDAIDALKEERSVLREEQIRLDSKREFARARCRTPWAPLPLSKIIEEITAVSDAHDELANFLAADTLDAQKLRVAVQKLQTRSRGLLARLQSPAPEPNAESASDPKIERQLEKCAGDIFKITDRISAAEQRLADILKQEEAGRKHLFLTQRRLNVTRHDMQEAEREVSNASVELARIDTRRDSFLVELRSVAPSLEEELDRLATSAAEVPADGGMDSLHAKMNKLRSQLDWIGGIDPATVVEYDETKERFETLSTHAEDLRHAIASLETILADLDTTIASRSDVAFKQLDKEFNGYFKKLFGGGEAKLIKLDAEPVQDEERSMGGGIELHATPPGKRLKSIALLSGGERALTSIALICAIMATNPSPFVVLDEVDAALDEANSKNFAEILSALAEKTQFVVITHNRATMQMAKILYGVTMARDGVSQVLSVKLEDS